MAQFKKSEDLEIYEMDYSTNTELQEICNAKQPVLFEFKSIFPELFVDLDNSTFMKYATSDIKVRDTADISVDSVPLKYDSFRRLAAADTRSHFITEGNLEFIEETGLYSEYEALNPYLKPSWTVQTKYDLLQGSENSYTPLRFHTNERQFYIITSGKIRVKMTPWKSRKYLHPVTDFSMYEFRSPIDAWDPAKNTKYLHDTEKIKYLEFDVLEGYVLFIPPYWWYSIQYSSSDTIVLNAIYNTSTRILANSWDILQYYLQQDNTTTKITKIKEDIPPMEAPLEPSVSEPQVVIEDPLKYVE